jgi:hypothetical protein
MRLNKTILYKRIKELIMSPLETRALQAYFTAANKAANGIGQPIQPSMPLENMVIDGKHYIIITNSNAILAVYRVRSVNGKDVLKGLKRYPKEIVAAFGS